MKVTELIAKLVHVYDEYGNLEVQATFGCGCCEALDDPQPEVTEFHKEDLVAPNLIGTKYLALN